MRTTSVTLHDDGGELLLTLVVRDADGSNDLPLRNLEGVQPPGSELQAAFGDGLHQVGVLERDFAFCNTELASVYLMKAALDEALEDTASVRVDGWELPIDAVAGVTDWEPLLIGIRARIRFIPSSPYWVLLSDSSTTAVGLL